MAPKAYRIWLVAVAAVLLACVPTLAFQRYEHAVPPLTAFLIAVTVAAWYGGRGPGVLATLLSVIAATWILKDPGENFEPDGIRVALMGALGVFVAYLAGSLHAARHALLAENARLNAVLDHLPVAAVIVDAKGKVVRSNRLVREILRHDPRPSVNEPTWTPQEPDGRVIPPSEYTTARALRGERVVDREYRYVRGDGTGTWIRASGAPIYEDGVVAGAVSLFTDIAAEKEAAERLRRAELRLDLALEASRMGRWHVDLATFEMECSTMCKANFGWPADKPFTYGDLVASIHSDDRAGMQESVQRAIAARKPYAAEYRVVWPDGTVRWVAARGRATYAEDGTPLVMDGVTIDFTERKRLEESLERQALSLRDADRRKDEFLAVLGHELRNPLAPMRTALELLKLRPNDVAVQEKTGAVFGRQLAQLTRLVDELLEVSRISSGKLRLELHVVDLGDLMREAIEASEPMMQSRRHVVRFEPPAERAAVHADRARLIQVFTNLLNNAAKYTDPGGEISFTARRDGRKLEVSVVDNGIGIEPESLPRVFELFAQADSGLSRAQGGLGLGLNVVRRLVELHGGAVSAHSDGPGRGSRFTVMLSAVEGARAAAD